MRNILKNASLFIVAIVFTFGFAINVKADGCDGLGYNQCRIGERGAIKINSFSNIKLNTYTYKQNVAFTKYSGVGVNPQPSSMSKFHVYQDKYSALFCLDAHLEGIPDLYVERFLMPTGSGIVPIFDAAIMSILTNGGIPKDASDYTDYWARNMAIRAITYTFGFFNGSNLRYKSAYYAGLTVAHNWNEFYASDFNQLNEAINALGMGSLSNPAAKSGYNFTGDTVNKAATYYVKALNDATEYARKLAKMPKVENLNATAGEVEKTTVSEGNVFAQKDVVHTLKLTNFSKANKNKFMINANNNGIKFAEGTQYDGLTSYISKIEINGSTVYGSKEEVANILGKDLVELGVIPENQEVEIKITAHFEGWESSTDSSVDILKCGQTPIKYAIDGSYESGLESQFGDYVGVVWYSDTANSQRYIGIEKRQGGPAATPWESPNETYLIEACSCDDLIEACVESEDINSDECTELKESNCGVCAWLDASCKLGNEDDCEKYTLECDLSCDTYVDEFECCDEQGDLIVSTLDDHEVSILGPGKDNPDASSVKACFVNKVDQLAANNGDGTYKNNANIDGVKDQKDNTYTLADMKSNSYCTVSCKEDYVMTMPTAKLVNAGRYFTFKAKVEGTKVCYTNTIDREKYNKDVLEAQIAVINAYNTYKDWEKASLAAKEEDHGSYATSASPGTCSCGYSYSDFLTGAHTEQYTYQYYYITSQSEENGTLTGYMGTNESSKSISSDINPHSAGRTSGKSCTVKPSGACTGGCSSKSCTIYTLDTPKGIPELQAYIDGEKAKALKALEDAQDHYEAILKEYDDCTNGWDTEINYDPDVYYDYSEDDYMNMLNNHIGEMEKSVSGISNSSWYCNSSISSNGFENRKGQLSDQNYEQCNNSNNGYQYTSISYVYCKASGICSVTPERVSDARYKKVTSGLTANYKPATLFYNVYPTGEITTEKGDDNVALENKLPVALNRERGIYKYQVKIENLGEFYNQAPKDNLGRYVGSSTAVADPNVLDYNCSYLVNITKTTGWVCDFDDDCDDDCIANCIGPNCDDYCDGTDCIADCIGLGCIYDSGAGSSIFEKVVSLNNLFPNGTKSYNWDVTKTGKALSTVTEIEEKGNSIYDEEPILSITLTPSSAREIKKYNNSVIDDGGYSNKTVSCENRNGIEEIVCYSSFIDDLIAGEFGDVVNDNSLIADEGYRYGDNSDYFSLWPNAYSEEDMIGPAWK